MTWQWCLMKTQGLTKVKFNYVCITFHGNGKQLKRKSSIWCSTSLLSFLPCSKSSIRCIRYLWLQLSQDMHQAAHRCGSPSPRFLHHSVNHRVSSRDASMWPFRSSSSVYHLSFPEVVPWWCRGKRTNILYHERTPCYPHNLANPH